MRFLKKFITLPLALFVSVNLPPISTKAELIQGKLNAEREELTQEQQNLLSQASTPDYICRISSVQTNPAPPDVNYRATLSCSEGIPKSLTVRLYHANVNAPDQYYLLTTKNYTCSSNPCSTITYVSTVEKTKLLIVRVTGSVIGRTGTIYSPPKEARSRRPYNDNGVMYPQIRPTRTDMPKVPFPARPYVRCCVRSPSFRSDLISYYQSSGWTIPPYAEAHHIKPLAWGGNNDYQYNGVLLGLNTHQLFTSWWAGFSNISW